MEENETPNGKVRESQYKTPVFKNKNISGQIVRKRNTNHTKTQEKTNKNLFKKWLELQYFYRVFKIFKK